MLASFRASSSLAHAMHSHAISVVEVGVVAVIVSPRGFTSEQEQGFRPTAGRTDSLRFPKHLPRPLTHSGAMTTHFLPQLSPRLSMEDGGRWILRSRSLVLTLRAAID